MNHATKEPDTSLVRDKPEVYGIACKRIEDALRQGDFFVEAA